MKKPHAVKREPRADFPLRVHPRHVDLLNSIPEFEALSTEQLFHALPKKYHAHVPLVGIDLDGDKMARAVIIGMLASEERISGHISMMFLEKTFVVTE